MPVSSARMGLYVPVVQNFATRVVMFHAAVADALGLHITDLKALRLLGKEPMSAGALGEHLGLTGATVTALIDRLETSGYVYRKRGADRRRVNVHAVREKIRAVDALYESQHSKMTKLLARFSAEEFSAILNFLEKTTQVLTDEAKAVQEQADAAAR